MSDNALAQLEDPPEVDSEVDAPRWELKKLKPKHLQICSLLAQGFKHVQIAALVDVTPQYITMLLQQPLIIGECQRLAAIAGTRLEALTEKSVDVIAETLENGNYKEKLQAARLQMEATHRIGRPDPTRGSQGVDADRLLTLSSRLVDLLQTQRKATNVFEGEFSREADVRN